MLFATTDAHKSTQQPQMIRETIGGNGNAKWSQCAWINHSPHLTTRRMCYCLCLVALFDHLCQLWRSAPCGLLCRRIFFIFDASRPTFTPHVGYHKICTEHSLVY